MNVFTRTLTVALFFVLVMVGLVARMPAEAAISADCYKFDQTGPGGILPLSSVDIEFTCTADATVYFGVCDSGPVPDDDLFNVAFNGGIVSSNNYNASMEFVSIGQADVLAGSHNATVNSINNQGGATYTFIASSDKEEVVTGLQDFCGADFGGTDPVFGACQKNVPVFITDVAPTNGMLTFDVLFGKLAREEGISTRTWNLLEGQRVNNDKAPLPAPNWARLWWQPEGEDTWYLLPSQYWMGGGTPASEYGLECDDQGVPSYHTSFDSMIPESAVPEFNH